MGEKKKFGYTIDEAVVKCASFMHASFNPPKGFRDYDIISKYMNDDEWEIHLRPNYGPERIMSFHRRIDNNHIEISVFEMQNNYNAQF